MAVDSPIMIEDAFSVAPDNIVLPDGGAGVERTAAGFRLNVLPGVAQPGLAFKATFRVPPGGLTVENCASISPAAAGMPGPTADAAAAAGRSVQILSGPTCQPNGDGVTQDCVWDVDFLNQSQESATVAFTFTTSQPVQPGTGIGGPSGTGLTPVDELTTLVKGPDIGPLENKTSRLVATFPLNVPPPSATVAVDAAALGPGAQPIPAAAPQADADPSDDTSCVRWDSNNPDDQGTPTNVPTEPQAGDPAGGNAPTGVSASNLAVSKTQSCQLEGANRARCTYQISITNAGQSPFQFAGGAVMEDTFSIPPADLTVGAGVERTATGFRVTDNGTRVFAPGEAVNFPPFNATFNIPPGGLKVENCAAITLPAGGTPIPAVLTPIDDLVEGTITPTANGLDKSVAITGDPVCVSRGAVKDCSWKVTVSNNGTVPFPFGFEFATAGANTEVSALGGLTSSRRDNQKTVFERGPVMLPGTSKTLTVQATLPADAAPTSATVATDLGVSQANSGVDVNPANDSATAVAGTAPAQEVPPGETSTDANPADNRSCVTFDSSKPDTQAPPAPVSLQINKTAAAATCEKSVAARNWRCSFEVTVTNAGDAPFNGPIVITDETNFQTIADAQGAACDNAGGLGHRCEIAAANIPPKGSTKFVLVSTLSFDSVPINTPPGECKLNNTVTIASPRGEGAATTSTATAQLPAMANQGKAIPCDPPSLRLSKTAQGCSATGSGFECRYRLTVTSTGPDPFEDAPIDIDERLPAGATVKTNSEGWSCPGTGAAIRCSHGNITLAVGASLDLDLTVTLPKSAVRPGTCEVKNDAEIVQPGRDMTQAGAQLKASASARITSPECQPPAPPPPSCTGGMVLLATGRCACPPDQEYNSARRACAAVPPPLPVIAPPPPPPRVCPDGYTGDYPYCVRVVVPPPLPIIVPPPPPRVVDPCTGGMIGTPPNCVCPPGQVLIRGECRRRYVEPPCPAGLIGKPPNCTCPQGQVLTRTGQCVADGCPADRPVGRPPYCCPPGSLYINGSCQSSASTPVPPPQYHHARAAGLVRHPTASVRKGKC